MNLNWILIAIVIVLALWLISLVRKVGGCLIRLLMVATVALALIYLFYAEQLSGLF